MQEQKANILIVDDLPENLLAMEAVLASLGQNIVQAASGAEALRCVLEHDFAVILMDVQMPGMDGFETASLILKRERSRHTPIIFVTAIDKSEEHISRGYGAGAVDYLFKPYVSEIVRAKVAVFVDLFNARQALADSEARLRRMNEYLEQEVKERTVKALQAEVKYRAVVESIREVFCTIRLGENIDETSLTFISGQCDVVLGMSPEAIYKAPDVFFHLLRDDAATREEFCDFIKKNEILTWLQKFRHGRTGELRWMEISVYPHCDEENRLIGRHVVIHDITDRVRAEEKGRQHAARTETLVQTAARLNADLSLETLLQTICEMTADTFGVEMTAVYLYDKARNNFRLAFGFGFPAGFKERSLPLPRETLDRYLKEYGPAAVIPDIRVLSDLPDKELYAEFDIRTTVCIGLFRKERVLGILIAAVAGREKPWSDDDFILLKAIGDQAALAITNARLYDSSLRRLEQVQALQNIDVAIASSMDLKLTLNVVLEQVVGQLRVDAAAVLLLNPNTQMLQYGAARGFRTKAIERTKLRIGEGHAGRVVLERASVIIPDVSAVPADECFTRKKLLASEGIAFYGATPLIAKGNVRGVVEVYHRSPFEPDEEWRNFLETLAGQASIAIDNALLFSDLQRSNMDLSLAYDATIGGWAMALDFRDKETEGHSRRVTELTEQIARAMGISEADLVHVRRGALLHDVGKLGIPDGILLKPGPLTEEEWVIMHRHPQQAFDMLSPIAYLRPALDIPYCHHEKLDGTGYPRGLKGEQIPLAARIFAVVDVWDALRSDRPYRAGMAPEKCREIIEADAGRYFDPQVVEAFFNVIGREGET